MQVDPRQEAVGVVIPMRGNSARLTFGAPVVQRNQVLYVPKDRLWIEDGFPENEVADDSDFTAFVDAVPISDGEGIWVMGKQFAESLSELRILMSTSIVPPTDHWPSRTADGSFIASGSKNDFVVLNHKLAREVIGLFWRNAMAKVADWPKKTRTMLAVYEGLYLPDSVERQTNRAHFYSQLDDVASYNLVLRSAVARRLVADESEIERRITAEWNRFLRMSVRSREKQPLASRSLVEQQVPDDNRLDQELESLVVEERIYNRVIARVNILSREIGRRVDLGEGRIDAGDDRFSEGRKSNQGNSWR